MFGLEVFVIGVALLYFSRQPARNVALAWTVIALEVVRSIVDDVYLLVRGADPGFYGVWIAIHLIIIVSGLWAIHSAKRDTSVSAMFRSSLDELVRDESGYETAHREVMAVAGQGFDLGPKGQATLTRDELHER